MTNLDKKHNTICPICDRPLILSEDGDVLECYDCGPVVFIGGRSADLVGRVAHSEAEDAPTLDEATEAAAKAWARLLTAPEKRGEK